MKKRLNQMYLQDVIKEAILEKMEKNLFDMEKINPPYSIPKPRTGGIYHLLTSAAYTPSAAHDSSL